MHDHGRLHPHHEDRLASPPVEGRARTMALGVLCLAALTTGVDMTITNLALPFIGRELDAPTNGLQWTVDIYNVALAGLLVLGGALADRYGRRRAFLLGYTVFAVASIGAAFSPSIGALIASRAVMGIGAAGVTAPVLAIIASMYPPEQRSRAIGAFVVFGATGLAIGPIVGGLLLDHLWWGSVFLVNVPIVAAGVVVGARTISESRAPEPDGGRPSLDVVGAVMSIVGLGGVLFVIIEGPSRGWSDPTVLAGLAAGVLVSALFVRRELSVPAPLFDVRILQRPAVLSGSITLLMAYLLFNSFLFVTPQYLQDVEGESVVAVGLMFVPFAVVFGVCSLMASKLVERLGSRLTISLGLASCAVGTATFAVTTGSGSLWGTTGASVVLGAGLSLIIAPPSAVMMNGLPAAKAGDGSSLSFVSRFVGGSLGIALVGSTLASVYAQDLAGAVGPLDADQVDRAEGSIQGALEVADTLDASNGRALTIAAQEAFERGATIGYAVVTGLAIMAAAAAWFALGRAERTGASQSDHT